MIVWESSVLTVKPLSVLPAAIKATSAARNYNFWGDVLPRKGFQGSRAFLAPSKQRSPRIFYPRGSFSAATDCFLERKLTRFSASKFHVSLFSEIGLSGSSHKIVIPHLFFPSKQPRLYHTKVSSKIRFVHHICYFSFSN